MCDETLDSLQRTAGARGDGSPGGEDRGSDSSQWAGAVPGAVPGAARPRALSAGRLHAPGGSTQSVLSVQMYSEHQALARPCCRLWGYRKADETPCLREGEGARQTRGGDHARHGQPLHRPGVRKHKETRVSRAARTGGELAGGLGRTGVGRSCRAHWPQPGLRLPHSCEGVCGWVVRIQVT